MNLCEYRPEAPERQQIAIPIEGTAYDLVVVVHTSHHLQYVSVSPTGRVDGPDADAINIWLACGDGVVTFNQQVAEALVANGLGEWRNSLPPGRCVVPTEAGLRLAGLANGSPHELMVEIGLRM